VHFCLATEHQTGFWQTYCLLTRKAGLNYHYTRIYSDAAAPASFAHL
jgi:hypothetical protein